MDWVGRFGEIARQNLRESRPKEYEHLQASGELEHFLRRLHEQTVELANRLYRDGLAAGFQPAEIAYETENQAVRELLLFTSEEERGD